MRDVLQSDSLSNRWLYLIVTSADPILPILVSEVLHLVVAICVALPYKFKLRLDKFWMYQDIKYDFTAELTGTGDRSQCDSGN